MENTETKSVIQTVASETAESARKLGGKLRRLAESAADTSVTWARHCGEGISYGTQFAALQAEQPALRRKLDRAHRELGRAVYAAYGKGDQASGFAEAPGVRAALQRVEEAEATLHWNGARLAELRKSGRGGDRTSS